LWIHGYNCHRLSLESVTNHIPSAFLWQTNRSTSRGFRVCLPTSPKYPRSITCPLLIDYPNIILYVDQCGWPPVHLFSKSLRTPPNDADVDPNSSDGVDPSSSEGVDTMSSEGVYMMSSEGVHTMVTKTPAKLLSVVVPNVSCRLIVRLP
jgi:hypothetical protein